MPKYTETLTNKHLITNCTTNVATCVMQFINVSKPSF